MQTILDCSNLIGDSLYLLKPVEQHIATYSDTVAVVSDRGLAFEMYSNALSDKIPVFRSLPEAVAEYPDATRLSLSAGSAAELSYGVSRQTNTKQMHISQAYARILGVAIDDIAPSTAWHRAMNEPLLPPCILLSPFSASCTYHSTGVRNKTLDDWKWEHIIRYLRKQNLPIKILGGKKDYLRCTVPLDDYITASSLFELELLIRSCKLFVGIDNGLGHIAASLDAPQISIWSKAASFEFIAPIYGKRTTFLQMSDPSKASPVGMLVGLRKFAEYLLEGRDVKKGQS